MVAATKIAVWKRAPPGLFPPQCSRFPYVTRCRLARHLPRRSGTRVKSGRSSRSRLLLLILLLELASLPTGSKNRTFSRLAVCFPAPFRPSAMQAWRNTQITVWPVFLRVCPAALSLFITFFHLHSACAGVLVGRQIGTDAVAGANTAPSRRRLLSCSAPTLSFFPLPLPLTITATRSCLHPLARFSCRQCQLK